MKTAHEWAVILTHQRISYGLFIEERPDLLEALKKTLFHSAKELICEVQQDAAMEGVSREA